MSPAHLTNAVHNALLNGDPALVHLAAGYGYSAPGPAMNAGLGRLEELEQELRADPGLINRSQCGASLLCYAVANRQRDVVRALLKQGADVEVQGPCGGALSYAVIAQDAAIVRLLLTVAADVNARDQPLGRTPLHWAASSGTPNVVQLLLDHGADPRIKDGSFQTPLDLARGLVKEAVLRRAIASIAVEP